MPPRHESAWIAHTGAPSFATLDAEKELDVLVVGAGITGLTAAHALHEAGVRVGVVEARRIGQGVTGHSTGHMTRLLDARYHHIREHFGDDAAGLIAEAAGEAMARVERHVERYGIDAACRRVPAYLYGEDTAQREEVEREREAARASGVALDNADALPIPGGSRVAVREADALAFDPYAYVVGLARALRDAGVPIAEQTRVLDLHPGETPEVETTAGRLRAGRIVLATHTPLGLSPLQTLAYPYRSYVLGLRLPGGDYPDALVYDAADPYHYVRTARLDGERLLVVGGADHKTGELEDGVDPYARVERWARERWPDAEVRYRWSAEVFEPADRLPLVGADPLRENVLVATGFSGDGLVWGTVAGGVLAALARGAKHPLAETLKPTRLKPGAGWKDFLRENVDVGVRFVTDRLARDVARAEELAPGEGGLLFEDGRHIAAYRDDEGALHRMSPVCTHMGCVVRWNAPDGMWECPCHGARYDARGGVVSGPATRALEGEG